MHAGANGRFPVLEVSGAPREMGRQVGEAQRDVIQELVDLVVSRFNMGAESPVTAPAASAIAAGAFPYVQAYAPHLVEEVRGTAEGAGVTPEQVMLLNARNMLSARPWAGQHGSGQARAEAVQSGGCTSVMVSRGASATAGQVGGQNWDNDPAMQPFSLVLVRKPAGRAAMMTWTQPGLIGYIGQNDRGMGILMNALNGPSKAGGVPWYFIVRAMYEESSLDGVSAAARRADRAITANAALVSPEGAADLEVTPDAVRLIREDGSGRLVHTNHCVHDDFKGNNALYEAYGQSVERKGRAEAVLSSHEGKVGIGLIKSILSDHEGYPTAICRHPNPDVRTGWQRSVVSIILEPAAGQMHVSMGNPCETPYETYRMG